MVLVLFFCAIIIVVMLLIIFTLISTVKIKINNLKIENPKKVNSKYEISISLNLMNKLKWISIKLNKQKIRKIFTTKLKFDIVLIPDTFLLSIYFIFI